jgi:hypothetical protein
MQCVAQGAPFVGVAVTLLNRRNIKNWATDTWERAHRSAAVPAVDEPDTVPDVHSGPAPGLAPAPATTRTSTAEESVGARVSTAGEW